MPKVAKHRKSNALMGIRISVSLSRNTESRSQDTEIPTYLWYFAFRYLVHRTPKVSRQTPKTRRTYGVSHFGIRFAGHRALWGGIQIRSLLLGTFVSILRSFGQSVSLRSGSCFCTQQFIARRPMYLYVSSWHKLS